MRSPAPPPRRTPAGAITTGGIGCHPVNLSSTIGRYAVPVCWSMRSWDCSRPRKIAGARFPRSHGPSEARVDHAKVNLWLTQARAEPHRPRGISLVNTGSRKAALVARRSIVRYRSLAPQRAGHARHDRGGWRPRPRPCQCPARYQVAFHLIEQPMLGIWCSGPRPVSATWTMASYSSRIAFGTGVVFDASSRPRYCSCRSLL